MSRTDVCGSEDGDEGGMRRGSLDVLAASLFAIDQAEDSDDVHASLAGSFDGGNGGSAGSANIIDDDDVGA